MHEDNTPPRRSQASAPFGSNGKSPNVVHEDRHVQPPEAPCNLGLARILREMFHALDLSRALQPGTLDLLDSLVLLLVPSVQGEVESIGVELLSGGFAYAGGDRARGWTIEVFLPAVGGSEEVESDEIEGGPQFCETRERRRIW